MSVVKYILALLNTSLLNSSAIFHHLWDYDHVLNYTTLIH